MSSPGRPFYSSTLHQDALPPLVDRYRQRMNEIDEFVKFHSLPPALAKRICKYVDFAFTVTKGMNVDTIASQLPPHLQLEVYLQLNKQMMYKVGIFLPYLSYLS